MPRNLFPLDNTKKFTDQKHVGHNRWHPDIPAAVSVKPGDVFRADCRECDTGFGATYQVLLPRAPQGRLYYLDVLHHDGTTERFGPAVKSAAGRSAGAGRGGASFRQEKTRPHPAPPAP